MELTKRNVIAERKRARREHTPAQIKQCRDCERILPIDMFTKSGGKKRICRECSRKGLVEWRKKVKANPHSVRYQTLKTRARKRLGADVEVCSSVEFKDWFGQEVEEGTCFYCQASLDLEEPRSLQGVTIDRMDNMGGYTTDNMVIACRRCNLIKGNWFTFDEMVDLAERYLVGREY